MLSKKARRSTPSRTSDAAGRKSPKARNDESRIDESGPAVGSRSIRFRDSVIRNFARLNALLMRRILIHFDTDPLPSVFDRVVAVDAGVDELFSYGGITLENVEALVHGAIFTRGPADLKHTAIFIGGSGVDEGQRLFEKVCGVFFGPMRVSVMMDSNGSNTTAAAAVLAAKKHVDLAGRQALVLGGTRARSVSGSPSFWHAKERRVRVASRILDRANSVAAAIRTAVPGAEITGASTGSPSDVEQACRGVGDRDCRRGRACPTPLGGPARGDDRAQSGHRSQRRSPDGARRHRGDGQRGRTARSDLLRGDRCRRHENEDPQGVPRAPLRVERPGCSTPNGFTRSAHRWPRRSKRHVPVVVCQRMGSLVPADRLSRRGVRSIMAAAEMRLGRKPNRIVA